MLALIPVFVVIRGLVLAKLWLWFVALPLNVPEIGFATAIGLAITFSLLTSDARNSMEAIKKDETAVAWGSYVGMGLIVPIFTLGAAWVLHQFQ